MKRVYVNGKVGLTTSLIPNSSGKYPVWLAGSDDIEFVEAALVRFEDAPPGKKQVQDMVKGIIASNAHIVDCRTLIVHGAIEKLTNIIFDCINTRPMDFPLFNPGDPIDIGTGFDCDKGIFIRYDDGGMVVWESKLGGVYRTPISDKIKKRQ